MSSAVEHRRKYIAQFSRFVIVDRDDKSTATLQRNTNHDDATLAHRFHRPVTGTGFHCCHDASSKDRSFTPIISGLGRRAKSYRNAGVSLAPLR